MKRFVLGSALLAIGVAALFAADADRWSSKKIRERFPDPDAGAVESTFVGAAGCAECHEDREKSLRASFHAPLLEPGKSKGCEECHGPGEAHVDDAGDGPIRHPGEADATPVAGACLRCHDEVLVRPVRGHRDWLEAGGEVRSCTTCHRVHVDKAGKAFDGDLGPFPDIAALEKHSKPIEASRCIECHPGFHPEMRRSGHGSLLTEGKTCGTCHGPGSLHAASGGDRTKIVYPKEQTPEAISETCNACHRQGPAVQRWTCAEHAKERISCIVCHDANARAGSTLRQPEFQLCGDCHRDVRAKLSLPNRHRVREGRVDCSDCHDPHGNTGRVRDKDVSYRACLECHGEKGGPFLFDHGVKRSEGCIACHDPHGSPNRRMLTHTRTKPLCIQCHPEVPHDLGSRRWDNCIDCHAEIHGSDLDRLYRR